jgi:ankyrin repeat protein
MNNDFKEASDKKALDATIALWNEVGSDTPSPEKIIQAVDNGANLNQPNERKFTPLLILAMNEEKDALIALLSKGALVSNFFLTQKQTADWVLVHNDRQDIYELLINHKEPDNQEARTIREFRENVWKRRGPLADDLGPDPDAPKPPQLRGDNIRPERKSESQSSKSNFILG